MSDVVHSGPTIAAQALRALRRYPDRVAFVLGHSSLSYRGAVDLIAEYRRYCSGAAFGGANASGCFPTIERMHGARGSRRAPRA